MLLAVDTSTAQVGLAVCDGSRVNAETIWYSKQHHTVEVAPVLAELLKRCGASMANIEALGVAVGPGSFTALRVGLALVKGLALPGKLPVVGISTLDILAGGNPPSRMPLVAVLQAGRSRLALGWYRSTQPARERKGAPTKAFPAGWKSQGPVEVMTLEALADAIDEPTVVAGELSAEDRQRLSRKKANVVLAPPSLCVRRPAVLAELAWSRWRNGDVDDPNSLTPVYLQVN